MNTAMFSLLALITGLATQQTAARPASGREQKPWFDQRLRAFFAAKTAQAHHLADLDPQPVPPEVWSYCEAGSKGDWNTVSNLGSQLCGKRREASDASQSKRLCQVALWPPVMETYLAWEQFASWKQRDLLAFGEDIIKSIPPGSIYFGGTDPGRGIITALSDSHAEAKPFFTLTQNALTDTSYLRYLQAMYGARIYIPTAHDFTNAFDAYVQYAERRQAEHKLRPGEDLAKVNGKVQVNGQVAVMQINGALARLIFDKNPDRKFYVEESFPLDWMYPYLSPHGLILKLNRQPLPDLSEAMTRQDHNYWTRYLQPRLGDWLNYDTPLPAVAAFIEQVYVRHDLTAFQGDPQFLQDDKAQRAFSQLRSSIGGLYSWRMNQAGTPAERERMRKEADFAFRQAFVLCPESPEALFRYVNLLLGSHRIEDALLVASTSQQVDPQNAQVQLLITNLKSLQARKATAKTK